jgi:hypothetical protein
VEFDAVLRTEWAPAWDRSEIPESVTLRIVFVVTHPTTTVEPDLPHGLRPFLEYRLRLADTLPGRPRGPAMYALPHDLVYRGSSASETAFIAASGEIRSPLGPTEEDPVSSNRSDLIKSLITSQAIEGIRVPYAVASRAVDKALRSPRIELG